MFSRLDRINDWPIRARSSHYSYDELVRSCSTSRSNLRRYFLAKFGKTPQKWLDELRLVEAGDLLQASDLSVKQIAARLCYEYPGNFARQFKSYYRCNPSIYAARNDTGNAADRAQGV